MGHPCTQNTLLHLVAVPEDIVNMTTHETHTSNSLAHNIGICLLVTVILDPSLK